jgi:hypothetical protein
VAVFADSAPATSLQEVEVGTGIGSFDVLLVQPGIAGCRQVVVRLPLRKAARQLFL